MRRKNRAKRGFSGGCLKLTQAINHHVAAVFFWKKDPKMLHAPQKRKRKRTLVVDDHVTCPPPGLAAWMNKEKGS
jgi:hypothetical protein